MIALTAERRKGVQMGRKPCPRPDGPEMSIHGIVSGILLLPHFCQPPAPLDCEKEILRWPGPFGSGFLSPQPPGAVGIGPVRSGSYSRHWANESWSFFFWGLLQQSVGFPTHEMRPRVHWNQNPSEILIELIPDVQMHSPGPAPNDASRDGVRD